MGRGVVLAVVMSLVAAALAWASSAGLVSRDDPLGELVVFFKKDVPESEYLRTLERYGLSTKGQIKPADFGIGYSLRLPSSALGEVEQRLAAEDAVLYVWRPRSPLSQVLLVVMDSEIPRREQFRILWGHGVHRERSYTPRYVYFVTVVSRDIETATQALAGHPAVAGVASLPESGGTSRLVVAFRDRVPVEQQMEILRLQGVSVNFPSPGVSWHLVRVGPFRVEETIEELCQDTAVGSVVRWDALYQPHLLYVEFSDDVTLSEQKEKLQQYGLEILESQYGEVIPGYGVAIEPEEFERVRDRLLLDPAFEQVSPYWGHVPYRLSVTFKPGTTEEQIAEIIGPLLEYSGTTAGEELRRLLGGSYGIRVHPKDLYDVERKLMEQPAVSSVHRLWLFSAC